MPRTASEAGTTVVAQRVTTWRHRQWYGCEGPLYLDACSDQATVLELWDCAPLSATVSGYADPWWARDSEGRWWIVCAKRANGRHSLPPMVAYEVDDEVRLRLSALKASREVVIPVTRSLLERLGVRPYEPQGHDVLRAFLDLPLVV
jgi:hypothetical protein